MSDEGIVETRNIATKDGGVLEVGMSQKFIDHLRQHFGLLGDQLLEDEHVKNYVLGAVDVAVVKAEQEVKDVKLKRSPTGVRRTRRRKKDAGS